MKEHKKRLTISGDDLKLSNKELGLLKRAISMLEFNNFDIAIKGISVETYFEMIERVEIN